MTFIVQKRHQPDMKLATHHQIFCDGRLSFFRLHHAISRCHLLLRNRRGPDESTFAVIATSVLLYISRNYLRRLDHLC